MELELKKKKEITLKSYSDLRKARPHNPITNTASNAALSFQALEVQVNGS